jgi:hypothetical protein
MELRLLEVEEPPPAELAARAARLARRCAHVTVDGRLAALGYRFYRLEDSELPPFFCKRFAADGRTAAITLLAGIHPRTGNDLLDDCRNEEEALHRVESAHGGTWLLRLTFGAGMVSLDALTGEMVRLRPRAFAAFAAELEALSPSLRSTCPVCGVESA